MIAQESIEQVKAAANVAEVVGRHIKLKKDGQDMVGLCPFHNEKSPSFKVNANKGIYKCFGCGVSGDSIEFVMKHENKTFQEAVTVIAGFYNILLEEDKPQPKRVYVRPTLPVNALTPSTLAYFTARGISKEILAELKVTQSNEWMPKAKGNIDVICFNYFRDGELINVKYRGKDKDFKLSKDAELIFYNLDSAKGNDGVIIVEGEIDCLSVRQAGVTSVVSVPNGATSGSAKLEYLDNCFDLFYDKKQIILMVDNDEPGLKLREELARRFGYDRCFKVEYPTDCKDANDVLLKHGPQAVKDCIQNAQEFPIEGVFSMKEMYEDVHSFYYKGYPIGVRCGIPTFDDHLQFMLGQFTTITGVPGSGKSEFTDYIMTELAKNHGWCFGVCSFENQPSSLHVTKIMEKYVGKSFAKRFNDADRIAPVEFDDAVNFVDSHFYFININKVEATLQGILDKAKELVLRKGIKGLVIDPWNYIEHKNVKGQTETQYTSECLTKIKAFALSHQIHIFFVAHPTKMPKVNGKYEVPTLYSISGSAHFFNKTDNGITVNRDFGNNTVDVYIQKVRYSWLGKIGCASFSYDMDRRRYLPLSPPEESPQFPVSQPPDNPRAGFQPTTTTAPPIDFWNNK